MAEKKKTAERKKSTGSSIKVDQSARVPPHNLEMERAVLCSSLIDPHAFAHVVDIISDESFYDRRHKLIFAAMSRLFESSKPIDALTVSEELNSSKDLEAIGGDPYLAGLSTEVTTAAHAEHYARIVQERASLRALITLASHVANEAYDAGDVSSLLDQSMQDLFEIAAGRLKKRAESIQPVLREVLEHLDELHKRKDTSVTGVATGFSGLDKLTSGFQKGDFIVIAARPSMGKTSFSLDIARYAAQANKVPVAFFSLEMAAMAIAMRIISADALLDLHRLRSGNLREREGEWERLSDSANRITKMPFFIDDSGSLSIMDLRARARLLKQQYDIGIVFVDYMQLMKPPDAASREQEVAKISRALKGMARDLNIPVVALSQLSRKVEDRGEAARPRLSDLRDSGAIEQDADVVIFIHRKRYKPDSSGDDEVEEEDNSAEIIVSKQRNGPLGTVKLTFLSPYASFRDQAVEQDSRLGTDQPEDRDTPF